MRIIQCKPCYNVRIECFQFLKHQSNISMIFFCLLFIYQQIFLNILDRSINLSVIPKCIARIGADHNDDEHRHQIQQSIEKSKQPTSHVSYDPGLPPGPFPFTVCFVNNRENPEGVAALRAPGQIDLNDCSASQLLRD